MSPVSQRNLNRYLRLPGSLGAAFDMFPATFALPSNYAAFCQAFAQGEAEHGKPANVR